MALKYHLITMGCPKNKVDSDGIEMLLHGADYRSTDSARDADVLIVNTCGFLEAAKEESIGVLKELGRSKRKNQVLIAAGCLAQRNGARGIAARAQSRWPAGHAALDGCRSNSFRQVRGGKGQRRFEHYSVLAKPAYAVPTLLDDPQVPSPARRHARP